MGKKRQGGQGFEQSDRFVDIEREKGEREEENQGVNENCPVCFEV